MRRILLSSDSEHHVLSSFSSFTTSNKETRERERKRKRERERRWVVTVCGCEKTTKATDKMNADQVHYPPVVWGSHKGVKVSREFSQHPEDHNEYVFRDVLKMCGFRVKSD